MAHSFSIETGAESNVRRARLGAALHALAAASLALALVALLFYFVTYLVYARSLFAFPFDYDQGEGFELYDAIRLARGRTSTSTTPNTPSTPRTIPLSIG